MKKTFALLAALCLAFGPGAALASDNPAVSILQRSVETMGEMSSVAVKGTLTAGVEGLVSTAVYDGVLSVKIISEPLKMHMLFQVMGAKLEVYGEALDGTLHLYEWSGSRWNTQTLDVNFPPPAELDSEALVAWLDSIEGLRIEGTEPVGDKEAWRLSATINLREFLDGEDLEEILGQAMGAPAMGIFPPYEPVPVQIGALVEGDTGRLLRVEIDLSRFVSGMLTRLTPTQPGMQSAALVAEMKFELDFSDFDAVPDFEIPAQVRVQ